MLEPLQGKRRHKLMPVEISRKIPKLYATEGVPMDSKVAYVKFFSVVMADWSWYAVEFDGKDRMFGYSPQDDELGYASLSEFAATEKRGMPVVERDLYFQPTQIYKIQRG